jgi:hypothetical protein
MPSWRRARLDDNEQPQQRRKQLMRFKECAGLQSYHFPIVDVWLKIQDPRFS